MHVFSHHHFHTPPPPRKRGKIAPRTTPLRIGVPPGTVVRKKRGGTVLGELINVGDTLCVARGGRGMLL